MRQDLADGCSETVVGAHTRLVKDFYSEDDSCLWTELDQLG